MNLYQINAVHENGREFCVYAYARESIAVENAIRAVHPRARILHVRKIQAQTLLYGVEFEYDPTVTGHPF